MMGTGAPGFAAPTQVAGQAQNPSIDISEFVDGATYIVTLAEDAASSYEGGVSGIPGTAPEQGKQLKGKSKAVKKYQEHLKKKQKEVAATVAATPAQNYTLAMNGFTAELTAIQASKLATNKNVIGVEKSQMYKIQKSTTEFLGLGSDSDGAGGVWEKIGGTDEAGKGIVVGIIDTGIAPENPSFAGPDLSAAVSSDTPYLAADGTITFNKADGGIFTGTCEAGVQFTAEDCNTKLIGAQYFAEGFGAANIGTPVADAEYLSPRDGNGHGSHTASTAAGNFGVEASLGELEMGTISGVAPAAKISAYKACWTGNDPGVTTDDGCFTEDLLGAIEAATADGVDVINYSIGGGSATSTVSAIDHAFFGAASAGIFVSASAGNSGPGASTLDNAAPWITTVGNSTFDTPQSSVILGNNTELTGASLSVPDAGLASAPLILADNAAAGVDAILCAPDSLDPAEVTGKIVVCDRGTYALVDKATEVAESGGVGMVLVNAPDGSTDLAAIGYQIPTVHLLLEDRAEVRAYAATENPTASMVREPTNPRVIPAPQIAFSSSRGPVLADGSNVLKPDVTAPGTGVLAAGANSAEGTPVQISLSGTSMAAPHVAGLAALYLGEQPNASVAEIKSALMTTAYNLVDAGGAAIEDVFTQGAGHVDPTEYLNPGMYFPAGTEDWIGYMEALGYVGEAGDTDVPNVEGSDLNQASIAIGQLTEPRTITRTVVSTEAGTYTPSVEMEGFDVTVTPQVIDFAEAGQEVDFTVSFDRTTAVSDEFSDGYLTWTSGAGKTVRIPMAVAPVSIVAPALVEGEGVEGSVDITVTPGTNGPIQINTLGLAKGKVFAPEEGTFIDGFLGAPIDGPPVRSKDHSGSGATGQTINYEMDVAEGTKLATFDLDAVDDTADLDLVVVQLRADGVPIALWQSATGAADEKIELADPAAGTYLVQANIYSPPAGAETAAFNLTGFAVPAVPTDTPLSPSPATLDTVQGQDATVGVSWEGLEYDSIYMGIVYYGDSRFTTVVNVTTGEAPCRERGNPLEGKGDKADRADKQGKPDHAKVKPCKPEKDDKSGKKGKP